MSKIEFGFDNSLNPNGSWEGISLGGEDSVGIRPMSSEYLDTITIDGEHYLICKIEDVFGPNKDGIGKIDVRKAIFDMYPDGSGVLYVDQQQNQVCYDLQTLLNSENGMELIERGVSIPNICHASSGPVSFKLATLGNTTVATAIRSTVFEEKRQLLASCHQSFSNLQKSTMSMKQDDYTGTIGM